MKDNLVSLMSPVVSCFYLSTWRCCDCGQGAISLQSGAVVMQWKGDITAMGEKDAHLKRTLCWWWWRCSLALVKWSHRRPQASTHIFEYLAAAGRRRSSVRFKVAVREIRMKLLVHFSSTGASSFQQSLWWWLNKSSGNKREPVEVHESRTSVRTCN